MTLKEAIDEIDSHLKSTNEYMHTPELEKSVEVLRRVEKGLNHLVNEYSEFTQRNIQAVANQWLNGIPDAH